MIVQCPSCSKRYRVNDANIPPSGGKIRCPECSHAFVVYPESASDPSSHLEPGEKTSVAQRPNMKELLEGMQQSEGGGDAAGAEEEEVAKTEVMSGSELPDFNNLFGGNPPPQDETVEMSNPLDDLKKLNDIKKSMAGGGSAGESSESPEDNLKTEQLSNEVVQESLGYVRGQAESSEPVADDHSATEIAPPSMLDDIPAPQQDQPQQNQPQQNQPQQQRRASVPDNPTPPPGQQRASVPDNPTPLPESSRFGTNPPGGDLSKSPGGPPANQGSAVGPDSFGSTPAPQTSSPSTAPGSAPGGPSAGGPSAGGPDPSHDGPWKLQTNFGLTYEFADNESLRGWLDSRDELDGYKLSADGDSFYPLADFPQVRESAAPTTSGAQAQVASTGKQSPPLGGGAPGHGPASQPGTGQGPPGGSTAQRSASGAGNLGSNGVAGGPPPPGGPSPGGSSHSPFRTASSPGGAPQGAPQPGGPDPSREKINPNEKFQPPSRDSMVLNIVLWGAFVLLAIAAIVLALQLLGVIDLIDDEPEPEEAPTAIEEHVVDDDEVEEMPEEEDGVSERVRQEVDRLLESAGGDMESNRLASAIDRLDRAHSLDPERIEVYEMKAEVHEELGEVDEAEELRARAEELRELEEQAEAAEEDAAEDSDAVDEDDE